MGKYAIQSIARSDLKRERIVPIWFKTKRVLFNVAEGRSFNIKGVFILILEMTPVGIPSSQVRW